MKLLYQSLKRDRIRRASPLALRLAIVLPNNANP